MDYFEAKLAVLMKEWDYCQTHIGRLDTIIFGIRGWAVSAFTAAVAVAVVQHSFALIILSIFAVCMFWLIDAVNRTIQRRFITRTIDIERYLRRDEFRGDIEHQGFRNFVAPLSFESYVDDKSPDRRKKQALDVIDEAKRPTVAVVYAALLALCFCALLYVSIKRV